MRDFPDIPSASSTLAERHEREYAVAPIPYRGVAMRHVGPRDAAWIPLPISTRTASSPLGLWAPDRSASGKPPIYNNVMIKSHEPFCGRDRERLAGGAGGGKERPGSPARCRRHPDRMSLRRAPDLLRHPWITSSLGTRGPVGTQPVGMGLLNE